MLEEKIKKVSQWLKENGDSPHYLDVLDEFAIVKAYQSEIHNHSISDYMLSQLGQSDGLKKAFAMYLEVNIENISDKDKEVILTETTEENSEVQMKIMVPHFVAFIKEFAADAPTDIKKEFDKFKFHVESNTFDCAHDTEMKESIDEQLDNCLKLMQI